MATLRDTALEYIRPSTLNIADLDKVPINVNVEKKVGINREGEKFEYFYAVIDEKEYRIPGVVLDSIKMILTKMPQVKFVAVMKEGTGKQTKYQVIPWTDEIKM